MKNDRRVTRRGVMQSAGGFIAAAALPARLAIAAAPVSPFGTLSFTKPSSAAHSLLARAQIDYSFSQAWTGFVQAGYGVTRYPGFANTPSLQVASVGAGVKYNLWRNLAMTAEYQYNYSNSKYAGGSISGNAVHISQNVISVGLTYQY